MELKRNEIRTNNVRKTLGIISCLYEQNDLIYSVYLITNWKFAFGAGRIGFLGMTYSNCFHTAQWHSNHNKPQRPHSQVKKPDEKQNTINRPNLPTTLNIFSRFWWEWSSGKFSATIVRDCKTKNHYNKNFLKIIVFLIIGSLTVLACNSSLALSVKGSLRLTFLPSSLTTLQVS